MESCKTEPLTFPFEPIEVPPNAEHRGQMYIGSEMAGAGVLVDVWTADTPNGYLLLHNIKANQLCTYISVHKKEQ